MIKFVRANIDVFIWSAFDMLGIPADVIIYKLNVDLGFKPVQQKKEVLLQRGVIYQHLANKIFKHQINRNMKVYVDDMLVKSIEEDWHITNLKKVFRELRKHQMKLNPNKYAFGVALGKFFDFLINQRGIEANLEKIHALLEMKCPTIIRKIQQLTRRIAALSQFISKSAERCLSFFKTLRQIKNFNWTIKCQSAFDDLKKYLSSVPLLSKPVEGKELYMCVSISPNAVSSVLIREDIDIQRSIYYISRLLRGIEI
uniref:Uncharacterized protein LOC105032576 n=1 Tax=Elaeis guineensis var. tenera TaxID=51953 RepID=A0A6I9Q9T7_ELAGV|nr:uncharacterized protein LOC105032576 [Elaeis guineensis]